MNAPDASQDRQQAIPDRRQSSSAETAPKSARSPGEIDGNQHQQNGDSLEFDAPDHPVHAIGMPDLMVGDHGRNSGGQRNDSSEHGRQNHRGKKAHDLSSLASAKQAVHYLMHSLSIPFWQWTPGKAGNIG
jgi:hypothetical protein